MLPAALAAALLVLGWGSAHIRVADGTAGPAAAGPARRVVLVADVAGRLPDPHAAVVVRRDARVVAVGGRPALAALAGAVERGLAAAVLDADQPFRALVAGVDAALVANAPAPSGLANALRRREEEARQFARLTRRELDTLGAMLAGRAAADIAGEEHVSLATVRSHIRAVLTKLGVSSQLMAVAVAHRSGPDELLARPAHQVHQF